MQLEDERLTEANHLETALQTIGRKRGWQWGLFFLVSAPGVLNAIHISTYVFFSHHSPHWCSVPELVKANWTTSQIRSFTIPSSSKDWNHSCKVYDWNYTELALLGYDGAVKYTSYLPKPKVQECSRRSFLEDEEGASIESEWDLVCDRAYLKSSVQSIFALGKLIGAVLFGLLSDKFGRKHSFCYAAWLYMISVPASIFIFSFSSFLFARFLIGAAGSGVYETAYTVLSEITVGDARTQFCTMFNISYPVGMLLLSLIAYYSYTWRTLQLYLSTLVFILLINCWLLPESPKWLLSEGRKSEAWTVIKWADNSVPNPAEKAENSPIVQRNRKSSEQMRWYKNIFLMLEKLITLFTNLELFLRTMICYFAWFVCALVYYALTLSGDVFSANKYIYIALNGVIEAFAYLAPAVFLKFFGRKLTCASLLICSGLAQISTSAFSKDQTNWIMTTALIGRFSDSTVFCILILVTSELFPTVQRNTAVGTSLMVAQVGSVMAPYLVDLLSLQGWYIPSIICGSLCIVTASLFLLLPETKNKPLFNTVNEIQPEDKVSLSQCCRFH